MHLVTVLSPLALALTATAVLVPPDVSDSEFWSASEGGILTASSHRTLNLECRDCPVAVGNNHGQPAEWKDGARTELVMDFGVENNQLTLNGRAFYPPNLRSVGQAMFVKQVYAEGEEGVGEVFDGSIPISTGIDVHPQVQLTTIRIDSDGIGPVTKKPARRISFEVLGLADKVMRVDTVELTISESDDNLQLFGVSTTPYTSHSTSESDSCSTVLCRVKSSIHAKIKEWTSAATNRFQSLKSGCMRKIKAFCSGFRLPTPKPHNFFGFDGPRIKGGIPKFTGGRPHHHPHGSFGHGHPGRFGYRHRHHHGFVRAMVGFFKHVITPIFVGVAVGMAVSGVGMLVGQAVVLLCMRARRTGYETVEQEENVRESFEELPKYEEAPGYEDAPPYVEDEKKSEN